MPALQTSSCPRDVGGQAQGEGTWRGRGDERRGEEGGSLWSWSRREVTVGGEFPANQEHKGGMRYHVWGLGSEVYGMARANASCKKYQTNWLIKEGTTRAKGLARARARAKGVGLTVAGDLVGAGMLGRAGVGEIREPLSAYTHTHTHTHTHRGGDVTYKRE